MIWGRADLHMHTNASDGWPSPAQLVDHAMRRSGLDAIAITDHDTIEGALRAAEYAAKRTRLHVIVGEEVSSRDGHIVGLFLEKRVKPGMSAAATIHAIHDQEGLAVAAHPFWRTQKRVRGGPIHGVGWLAAELDFDAIEVENATPGFYVFNQLAHRLNLGLGAAELGGSDARPDPGRAAQGNRACRDARRAAAISCGRAGPVRGLGPQPRALRSSRLAPGRAGSYH